MKGSRAFSSMIRGMSRWTPAIIIITIFCGLEPTLARAQTDDGEAACQRENETRNRFGASEEALPHAEACVEAIKRRAGAEHPDYGVALYNLTDLLTAPSLKRGPEAVALNRTARAIFEKAAADQPSNPAWPRYLIKICERLVAAGDDVRANMEIAVKTVRRMEADTQLAPWEKGWPGDMERDLLRAAALQLVKANQLADALSMAERIVKNVEMDDVSEVSSKEATARALNGVAWYALLANQPQKALAASERAISLAPDRTWLAINQAHALMFLGNAQEARAAYLKHKGTNVHDPLGAAASLAPKRSPTDKWEVAVAWDFSQFRQHGLEHAQMADIETALRVTDSPLVVLRQARELIAEGKNAEALALHLGYMEKVKARFGEISTQHASLLQNLALRLPDMNRSDLVEEVTKHALAITEELVKKGSEQDGASAPKPAIDELKLVEPLLMLAAVYEKQERMAEAEPLAARAQDLCEKTAKADQEVLSCLARASEALLHVYAKNNRQAEAEQMLQRVIGVGEKKWGDNHPNVARLLQALASILAPGERAKIEERSVNVLIKAIKAGRSDTEFEAAGRDPGLADLANRFVKQGQLDEAERALRIVIKYTGNAQVCDTLMDLYKTRGKFSETETFYKTLVMDEERYKSPLGCAGRQIDAYLGAEKYYQERQNAAQSQFYQRLVIKARERRLYNWNHEWTKSFANDLDQLAKLYIQQERLADAKSALERAQELTPKQDAPQQQDVSQKQDSPQKQDIPQKQEVAPPQTELAEKKEDPKEAPKTAAKEAPKNEPVSDAYFKDAYLARKGDGRPGEDSIDKSFVMAQRLRRMPDGPDPLTIAQAQASLRPDEAVVLYLTTLEKETASEKDLDVVYVWAITKTQAKWERVEFGGPSNDSLRSRAAFLRCGLDPVNWAAGSEAHKTCEQQREAQTQETLFVLAVKDPAGDRAALRRRDEGRRLDWFDAERAYELYTMLFSPISDVIGDKQLLITAAGPLAQFPFDALVTEKPKPDDALADVKWLARKQVVTVLPSVALRTASGAVGSPLLNGRMGEKLQHCGAKGQSRAQGGGEELCSMARSLNIYWAADPDVAEIVAAGAASALKAEPGAGRSEALRRAKLALIDKGGKITHPYFWAPFALIGEDQR
jgi:hypothetical protein